MFVSLQPLVTLQLVFVGGVCKRMRMCVQYANTSHSAEILLPLEAIDQVYDCPWPA